MSGTKQVQNGPINYFARLAPVIGGVTATILLQQIIYWYGKKGGRFYKYRTPCDKSRPGDSWCEELGFSPGEFDGARKKIATKLNKGEGITVATVFDMSQMPQICDWLSIDKYLKNLQESGFMKKLVAYWTTQDHKTYYAFNQPLFDLLFDIAYTDESPVQDFPNREKWNQLIRILQSESISENTAENTKDSGSNVVATSGKPLMVITEKSKNTVTGKLDIPVPEWVIIDDVKWMVVRDFCYEGLYQFIAACECGYEPRTAYSPNRLFTSYSHDGHVTDTPMIDVCSNCDAVSIRRIGNLLMAEDELPVAEENFTVACEYFARLCLYGVVDTTKLSVAYDLFRAGYLVDTGHKPVDKNPSLQRSFKLSAKGLAWCNHWLSDNAPDDTLKNIISKMDYASEVYPGGDFGTCGKCGMENVLIKNGKCIDCHRGKSDDHLCKQLNCNNFHVQDASTCNGCDYNYGRQDKEAKDNVVMVSDITIGCKSTGGWGTCPDCGSWQRHTCSKCNPPELTIAEADNALFGNTDGGARPGEFGGEQPITDDKTLELQPQHCRMLAIAYVKGRVNIDGKNINNPNLPALQQLEGEGLLYKQKNWKHYKLTEAGLKLCKEPVWRLSEEIFTQQQIDRPIRRSSPAKKKQSKSIIDKQAEKNMFEAVSYTWELDPAKAAWKIQKFKKWFLGIIGDSKADKRYGDDFKNCQLALDKEAGIYPATAQEVIAFGYWYKTEYEGTSLPERGEKLLSHFMGFRGAGDRYDTFMRKALKAIAKEIPNIKIDGINDESVKPEEEGEITPEQKEEFQRKLKELTETLAWK